MSSTPIFLRGGLELENVRLDTLTFEKYVSYHKQKINYVRLIFAKNYLF